MVNDLVISLFRHGLTEANERKAYIGWTDEPLSTRGRRNLLRKDETLREMDLIISSPLQRCTMTAKLLFPGQSPLIIDELKEIHFGAWEGMTYEQLQHHESYRKWLTNIFTEPIEAGETYDTFSERINTGFKKINKIIIEEQRQHIAIVTHGGVIRHVLHTIYPYEKSFFDWHIPFGGGYELTWKRQKIKDEKRCTLLAVEPTMVKQIG